MLVLVAMAAAPAVAAAPSPMKRAAKTAVARGLRIAGLVTFEGHRIPARRNIYAQISRDFPGLGGVAEQQVKVDPIGRFSFQGVPPGEYWLSAYIDDDRNGKFSPNREIVGYANPNPVAVGEGRALYQARIDLDPIAVTLETRFEPARADRPAHRVLQLLRVVPLHPRTGQFLESAEVTVAARKIDLAPGENAFVYAPSPPEEAQPRYVIEVLHPAYGRTPRKHPLAPRETGWVPEARMSAGEVEWRSPPWVNFAQVRVIDASGAVTLDRTARSPVALGTVGPGTRVVLRAGRVDVQRAADVTVALAESVLRESSPVTRDVGAQPEDNMPPDMDHAPPEPKKR
jgi:hypothetical protein